MTVGDQVSLSLKDSDRGLVLRLSEHQRGNLEKAPPQPGATAPCYEARGTADKVQAMPGGLSTRTGPEGGPWPAPSGARLGSLGLHGEAGVAGLLWPAEPELGMAS